MLPISQHTFGERLANECGLEYGRSVLMLVTARLGNFDKYETSGDWLFHAFVGSMM